VKESDPNMLRGRDRIVVGFTTKCTISAYHHKSCEFEPRSWITANVHDIRDRSQIVLKIEKNKVENKNRETKLVLFKKKDSISIQ
jgi:hypothetical protein